MAKTRRVWISWALSALLTICGGTRALAVPPTAYQSLHCPEMRETALASPPISVIFAGGRPIKLEHTMLKAVQRTFGGGIYHGGDAADSVTWICYSTPSTGGGARVYWFISNNEMGGGTSITEIAVQYIAMAADKRCARAPAKLRDVDSNCRRSVRIWRP